MKNLLAILLVAFLLLTCDEKDAADQPTTFPVARIQSINVSGARITLIGSIENDVKTQITDHGYLWSLNTPTVDNAPSKSLGALSATANIQGEIPMEELLPNKLYLTRIYYKTNDGVFYSSTKGFRTPDLAPVISSFTPTSATWGDTIRIAGQHFSPGVEDNKITFGNFSAPCVRAKATELVTVVPTAMNISNVKVTVAVLDKTISASSNFNLLPPVITSFSPVTGGVGSQITISGKNFRRDFTTVYLAGKEMVIASVTENKIVAEVPGALANGDLELSVTVASQTVAAASRFSYNGVTVTEFLPASGTYNDVIIIKGSGFRPGNAANIVTFGATAATVIEAGPAFLKALVPPGLTASSSKISVSNTQGYATTQSEFTLLPAEIISVTPAHPSFGERITVTGRNFNPIRISNILSLNGTTFRPDEATNTTLVFSLWESHWAPNGISRLSLTIGNRTITAPFDFETSTPVISSFTPQTGIRSGVVVVHGENFHPSANRDTIYFGSAYSTATSASANMITFKVPKSASAGNYDIKIKVGGKSISKGTFTVRDSWSQKASIGGARTGGIAFSIGGYGYAGGGFDTNNRPLNDLYQYDPAADTWTKKGSLPVSDQTMIAFATANYGYVLSQRQLWQYNPATNTWILKSNFPGAGYFRQSAFAFNDKVYVGLGINQNGSRTNELYEFNESTNQWTSKASFPPGAYEGFASFTANGKGYTALSWSSTSDLWEYDPDANSWAKKLSLATIVSGLSIEGRNGAVAISTPSKGYFGTGSQSSYSNHQSDLYEYDPVTNKCVRLIDVPGEGRTAAFGFSINNKLYLGGGTSYLYPPGYNVYPTDFYECDPSIRP